MNSNSAEHFGFWDANLRVIEAHYPGLAAQFTAKDELSETDIRLESAAAGDPTLLVRGIHVHSPRDPVREGRRLGAALEGDGPIFVLGFGLGYAAEAAAAAAPDRPVIVVERHPLILKKAFECRDLRAFLTEYQVLFVLGGSGEAITGALQLLSTGAIALVRNRALLNLDEEWYAQIEARIRAWSTREDVNMATLRRFGKRWVRNLAVNREAIRDLPGISRLKGRLAPFPVLLAAAGPSLDSLAHLLPELARRAVVVAVDTCQRLLLSQGVAPDFTVVVDPQYWNARHLDRAPAPKTCLITESTVYPAVFHEPFARAFLCSSLFPLGRFIEDRLDEGKGSLGAGGSVATTAWDFARTLGDSSFLVSSNSLGGSIWAAGLDLAYPNLKTHFRGALFETRSLAESRRFDPAETWSVRALRDGHPFTAPSASGGVVPTDKRLSLYASWFEAQFRRYPETKTYSLSPEGLAIPGFPVRPVEELLALPPRRTEIDRALAETFARIDAEFNAPAKREDRAARYDTACKDLLAGLETLKTLAAESAELAEKAIPRDRLIKALGTVNRRIMESEVKDVAGFLFPPIAELEAGLASTDPYGRYRELSAKLYRSLAEAVEYHLTILGR
ncbi:hypothetical protein AGMMS49944_07240 [Spirochaetia bacterium]|nr:hypothetical protein AGMMS49944_07240 [Spirochaetia bacterium]